MCGICGIFDFNSKKVDKAILENMCRTMSHRGPDSAGYYIADNIGFGHRRLAIIDLKTGNQPIHNEDKTIWLVTNGEIYNFKELRTQLTGRNHKFYTQTDAEVIIHLYEDYGEDCLQYLRGMFALAIWDEKEKKLFIARDRLGKKPLCYLYENNRFIFASEIKAILKAPQVKKELDLKALNLYLSFQYVPAPLTIFGSIKKLPPAHFLVVKDRRLFIKRYWQLEVKAKNRLSLLEYKMGIRENLKEAVRLRLISDVPVGAFLSGGIDSSIVVGLMSSQMSTAVKTFSVGFSERLYNELYYARLVAKKFNTEHHELLIKPEVVKILPEIIKYFDEPFADYSNIPTYYISQFAAGKVKVVLNGDGGDESFAGYQRYSACQLAEYFDMLPFFLKGIVLLLFQFVPRGKDIRNISWQLRRFAAGLKQQPPLKRYLSWISSFRVEEKKRLLNPDISLVLNDGQEYEFFENIYKQKIGINFLDKTIQLDIDTYLPYDLLVKMDMATMANSIEARSPFLDHKFMEYVATIPLDMKINNFRNKYVLKRTFTDFLPASVIRRSKRGFGIPIGSWFRTELREFLVEVLMDEGNLSKQYFNQQYIRQLIDEHLKARIDHGHKLWAILVFELWLREYVHDSSLSQT